MPVVQNQSTLQLQQSHQDSLVTAALWPGFPTHFGCRICWASLPHKLWGFTLQGQQASTGSHPFLSICSPQHQHPKSQRAWAGDEGSVGF